MEGCCYQNRICQSDPSPATQLLRRFRLPLKRLKPMMEARNPVSPPCPPHTKDGESELAFGVKEMEG